MIIDNQEFEIRETYYVGNNQNKKLKIKLKGIDNVNNMRNLFYNCSILSFLPDISKWNTNNVYNMSNMFSNCSSLISIPDF